MVGSIGHRKLVLVRGRYGCPWVKVPKPCGTSRMLQRRDRVDNMSARVPNTSRPRLPLCRGRLERGVTLSARVQWAVS